MSGCAPQGVLGDVQVDRPAPGVPRQRAAATDVPDGEAAADLVRVDEVAQPGVGEPLQGRDERVEHAPVAGDATDERHVLRADVLLAPRGVLHEAARRPAQGELAEQGLERALRQHLVRPSGEGQTSRLGDTHRPAEHPAHRRVDLVGSGAVGRQDQGVAAPGDAERGPAPGGRRHLVPADPCVRDDGRDRDGRPVDEGQHVAGAEAAQPGRGLRQHRPVAQPGGQRRQPRRRGERLRVHRDGLDGHLGEARHPAGDGEAAGAGDDEVGDGRIGPAAPPGRRAGGSPASRRSSTPRRRR